MDISDILRQERFKELHDHLSCLMLETAGDYLMGRMIEVFGNNESAMNWYFSYNEAFNGMRPYDFLNADDPKENLRSQVENLINSMDR